MGRLLPGQLRSAESTADLAQDATRADKYCSMSAMPTQSQGWCPCIASPKRREQRRDALGVHLDENPAENVGSRLMPPGLSAYPSVQHLHTTSSPRCRAQPGRAPCICIVPNQMKPSPKAGACCRQTHGALGEPALVFHDQSQGSGPKISGCTHPISLQRYQSIPTLNPRRSPVVPR